MKVSKGGCPPAKSVNKFANDTPNAPHPPNNNPKIGYNPI